MELHDFYTSLTGWSSQDEMGRACGTYGGEENTDVGTSPQMQNGPFHAVQRYFQTQENQAQMWR
jgi:hypothetical protein